MRSPRLTSGLAITALIASSAVVTAALPTPQAAAATTAVIPKEITMAVSVSACGSGSV